MIVKEICAKTVLSKSKVFDYVINPYIGCEHGCIYCYARFIKRFTGHKEKWGEFVDVKINAATLLAREVKKKPGRVWISGLCDPYQPLERKYGVTRKCLEILLKHNWPVTIQTKSSLVLRDIELFKSLANLEVMLTITTADEGIRQVFEPNAPTIKERIETLERLRTANVKTSLMIAPLLPRAEGLIPQVSGKVNYVLIDRVNYHYADWAYKKHELEYAMNAKFFDQKKTELASALEEEGIPFKMLY